MKKVFLEAILAVFLVSNAFAGVVLYENGNLEIGVDGVTAGVFYDIRDSEFQGGLFSSVMQYGNYNLDLGVIGELEKIDEEGLPEPLIGLSGDVFFLDSLLKRGIEKLYFVITKKGLNLDETNLTTKVGSYVSYNIKDEEITSDSFGYGIYSGVKYKF